MEERYYSTGKRKTSIARVWLSPGDGDITVNNKKADEYFRLDSSIKTIQKPLVLTDSLKKYTIKATVKGGGLSGQAGAVRHGISKALRQSDPNFCLILKRAGLLTRDSRIKERKKYGKRGARKSFQFSKR